MNVEDYTQRPLEDDGVYRGFPVSWTVEPSTKEGSESVAIAFRFAVHQKWHPEQKDWSEVWPTGYFVENRTWIVKVDGKPNPGAIESLSKCGLWDGDWDKLAGPVPNVFVLLDVAAETYEGTTRYRANWVNPNADEPKARGSFSPADPDLLASMRQRFQSQTKAIAGGKKGGAAPAPPAPSPAAAPTAAPVAVTPPQQPPTATSASPPPSATPPAISSPVASQEVGAPPAISPPSIHPPAAGTADDPIDIGDTPF